MKFHKKQWPSIKTWWSAISNGIAEIRSELLVITAILKAIGQYEFEPHGRSCGNCVFAYRDNGTVKQCRINPPTVSIVAQTTPTKLEEISGWPRVSTEDGCGKHRGFTKQ